MIKGFVTLAVGDDRYYRLAANLLLSYRHHVTERKPFAIVADRENEWTALFDKVVILPQPSHSYMDKIELLAHPAFDRNVFIDADCLVYRDINSLLDECTEGVTLYGSAYPLSDNQGGWYTQDNLCEYKERVDCSINSHGGIMFYCDDEKTRLIYDDCKKIASHYADFHFSMFEKPADEPIIALAMAVHHCMPIDRVTHYDIYGFFPTFRDYRLNVAKGLFSYTFDGKRWIENAKICHWQNYTTTTPVYLHEIDRLKYGDGILSSLLFVWRKLQFLYGKNVGRLKSLFSKNY